MENLQPQGKLETVMVENLATFLWRKRRLLQAETAEIEKSQFLNWDLTLQNEVDGLDYAQLKGASDTKVGSRKPLNVPGNAMGILNMHRLCFAVDDPQDGDEVRGILKTIYGYEKEGPQPYGWRQMWLMLSKLLLLVVQGKEDTENPVDTKQIATVISEEMIRLAKLYDTAAAVEALRCEHNIAGAPVPRSYRSPPALRGSFEIVNSTGP